MSKGGQRNETTYLSNEINMFGTIRSSLHTSRYGEEDVVIDPVERRKEETRARKELRRLEAKEMNAQQMAKRKGTAKYNPWECFIRLKTK